MVVSLQPRLVGLAIAGVVVGGAAALGGPASAAEQRVVVRSQAREVPALLVIKDFDYRPSTLTVRPGAKVRVVNKDSAAHTVTNKAKGISSGNIAGKTSKLLVAPKKRGTYSYLCLYHPNMEATLKVR